MRKSYLQRNVSFLLVFFLIVITFLARLINILICSRLANITRSENYIDGKKQFFLIFAGIRGAMAFALALKSRSDFQNAGKSFLIVTVIFTTITLIYSSVLLDCVLEKCNIMDHKAPDSTRAENNCFGKLKSYLKGLNVKFLIPLVYRDFENIAKNENNINNIISINQNITNDLNGDPSGDMADDSSIKIEKSIDKCFGYVIAKADEQEFSKIDAYDKNK